MQIKTEELVTAKTCKEKFIYEMERKIYVVVVGKFALQVIQLQ